MRTIKQDLESFGVQCIFAVGPFSIVFMRGESGSPFNVREAVPVHFFTLSEVSALLGQFAAAKGVSLEAGVAADIHELTAGHAGLVCACGRALESAVGLQEHGQVKLTAWLDFRARHFIDAILAWPTIGDMARSVSKMIPSARLLLEQALLAGNTPLELATAPSDVSDAARYLAAEGWLVASGAIGIESYRITSPLVRSLAMRRLAKERGHELTEPLPFDAGTEQKLDVPSVLRVALLYFRPTTMRSVSAVSSKTSTAAAAVFELPGGRRVPNEAVYHFELFSVLRQWLGFWGHADLYPEANVMGVVHRGAKVAGMPSADIEGKVNAGMLISPSRYELSGPKHVLELVASSSGVSIQSHFSRTIEYMVSHCTDRGACIIFTAVASASAVSTPATSLFDLPDASQLNTGLVAIHVVHDLNWTVARLHWLSRADSGTFYVDLDAWRKSP